MALTVTLCVVAGAVGALLGLVWGRRLYARRGEQRRLGTTAAAVAGGAGALVLLRLDDRLGVVLATFLVAAGLTAVLVIRRSMRSDGVTRRA